MNRLLHNLLIQFASLIPNVWGTAPNAVSWAVVFFAMLAFVFAVKMLSKAFNLLLAAALIVLAGHFWLGWFGR